MRGIRGAITVEKDTKDEIYQAVKLMVMGMCRTNKIAPKDIGAAIFSATPDPKAAFPAAGARFLKGFDAVPLFDTMEPDVENALPHCIRALLLVDTDKPQSDIRHIYLGGAIALRPDLQMEE